MLAENAGVGLWPSLGQRSATEAKLEQRIAGDINEYRQVVSVGCRYTIGSMSPSSYGVSKRVRADSPFFHVIVLVAFPLLFHN
jgi:hypothetical protein